MDIFRKLMGSSSEFPELNKIDPILRFHFEFNRLGYIPYYLPILANYGRTHNNQEQYSESNNSFVRTYDKSWKGYRKSIVLGHSVHCIRESNGKIFTIGRQHPRLMRICLIWDMFIIKPLVINPIFYTKWLLKKVFRLFKR